MSSDWTRPFEPDEHTVALYHFDEGEGDLAHDACGDRELTLRAHGKALWGSRPGFGATARFTGSDDDADLLVGPVNDDKLELRGCTREWTIEVWLRLAARPGERRDEAWAGASGYLNICGTDDEGFGMPEGVRAGWNFYLLWPHWPILKKLRHHDLWVNGNGLAPQGRYIGSYARAPHNDVNQVGAFATAPAIADDRWHHVAWQFRYEDQMHFMFLDGTLIYRESTPGGRAVANDASRCDLPFVVGGFLHSQHDPDAEALDKDNFGVYLGRGACNFAGEIDELRISDVMRYPAADRLAVVRRELPDAGVNVPYSESLSADAAQGAVTWKVAAGRLPAGLQLDEAGGTIEGTPTEASEETEITVRAADAAGHTDEHTFRLCARPGRIVEESVPVAFAGQAYRERLTARHMVEPVRWEIPDGALPAGISFDRATGELAGIPGATGRVSEANLARRASVRVEARDAGGQTDCRDLVLAVLPGGLRHIELDEHTVALWDWQGASGKLIPDLAGDEELTLTWTNVKGDTRLPRPGWGRYPSFIGGGEGGFVGPQHNDKVDLRTCTVEWTVETWLRRGGPVDGYGREFHFGHVFGTYDNTERGVWELYLSDHDAPDGSMAPGVHFLGAEPEHASLNLHPWSRPDGIVAEREAVGIRDTEWHHVAWQYSHADEVHQLFLDGIRIWQMYRPDGRRLVNDRRHDAQFSISSRLKGYSRYGGAFNWLGWGNFFGQIGEMRLSSIRRY